MQINQISQLASLLSVQKTNSESTVAIAALANQQIEAQGAATITLIQTSSIDNSLIGNSIDIKI